MDDQQPPEVTEGGERFPTFDPTFSSEPEPARPRAQGISPYRGGGQPNPWLVGLAVGVVLAALSIIAFGLFSPEDGSATGTTSGTTAAPGQTTAPGGTTSPGGTTIPGDTSPGTQATLPGNGGSPNTITPVGDRIPIAELTMSSNDIGPLDFGDDGSQVLGRLAATFDQPTDDTGFFVGNGGWGECPGDSIRVVRWGPLNVVVMGEPGDSQFVSYRLDLDFGGVTTEATDMATLSGLRVGDSVGQLESTYEGFVIEYVVDEDVGLVFELRSERGGELLLWGPVDSQAEDAPVTGIYSPDSCEA